MGYEKEKIVLLGDLATCRRIEARRGTNGTWRVVYWLKDTVEVEGKLMEVASKVWVLAKRPRGKK